jgi:antitoxin (DNA-binding transcriptional repressor) of toxin-antitoxin stability system
MAKKIKYINVNVLQANVSKIIKEIRSGFSYKIMRYSEPVAVILSDKEYEKLLASLNELRAACRSCVLHPRKTGRKK